MLAPAPQASQSLAVASEAAEPALSEGLLKKSTAAETSYLPLDLVRLVGVTLLAVCAPLCALRRSSSPIMLCHVARLVLVTGKANLDILVASRGQR